MCTMSCLLTIFRGYVIHYNTGRPRHDQVRILQGRDTENIDGKTKQAKWQDKTGQEIGSFRNMT